nr:hypothetical protein [Tanacetum cinerariifolium]
MPSQTSRGILVGPKIGFNPHKEYRHVSKKSTASCSGNKKKGAKPTIEVSNSNPFDILNSVDNDVKFGTNIGTTNLVYNRATSSGSSFMNVDNSRSDDPYDDDMYEGQDLSHELQAICDNLDIRVDLSHSLDLTSAFFRVRDDSDGKITVTPLGAATATSSGSSFMNVDNSSSGTTPIIEKIEKFENLLTSGQAILVDKAGNPLKRVEFLGEYDSEDDVALVDNDMARSMTYEKVSFGTQSLLEQWSNSYDNGDYKDDPYDDDMYECQDLSHELQAICDNLDIRVRGCKKK